MSETGFSYLLEFIGEFTASAIACSKGVKRKLKAEKNDKNVTIPFMIREKCIFCHSYLRYSVFCFWGESTVSENMKMAFYFYGPHSRRPGPFTFIVFEYLLVLLNVGVGNAICTKDNIQKFLLTFFCVRSRELSSLVRSLFRFHLELVKQKCCSRSKNLSVRARTYTFI